MMRRIVRGVARRAADWFDGARDRVALRRLGAVNAPCGAKLSRVVCALQSPLASDEASMLDRIESARARLLESDEPLVDGSLGAGGPYDEGQSIRAACEVSKPARGARFLYLLAREFEPAVVLELGTNLGISSAYIAAALARGERRGRILTLEASPYRTRIARELHRDLGLTNVSYSSGLFGDTLRAPLIAANPIELAFIDGHHQYQPTLDYFAAIRGAASDGAVVVLDDIRWSSGMWDAWKKVAGDEAVRIALDLGTIGVVIVGRRTGDEPLSFRVRRTSP